MVVPPPGPGIFMKTETATLSGLVVRHRDDAMAAVDVSLGRLRLTATRAIQAESPAALLVRGGATVLMTDCHLTNRVGAGIVAIDGAAGSVDRCRIEEVGTSGVVLRYSADLVFRDCTITEAAGNGVLQRGGRPRQLPGL